MHIPPGFVNVQVAGSCSSGQDWLIGCGSEAVDWDPTDTLPTVFPDYLAGEQYLNGFMTDNFVVNTVRVILGTSDPSAPITYEANGVFPGQIDDDGNPAACVLVKKSTNTGGRKGRGRTYFPGVSRGEVDGAGFIVGDLALDPTNVTDFWPDLLSYLGLAGAFLLHTSPLDDPSEITSFSMDPKVATQRGRLRS